MNPTQSPSRRERIRFLTIAVILSLCVLANMILIFCMSAEDKEASGNRSDGITDAVVDVVYPDLEERPPAEQQSIFQTMAHLVRKLAHFSEFALLGFLVTLLLGHLAGRIPALRLWLRLSIAALFCLLYAISDEVHQIFSERGPAVRDVFIDFGGAVAGILCGAAVWWLLGRIGRAVRGAMETRAAKRQDRPARKTRQNHKKHNSDKGTAA